MAHGTDCEASMIQISQACRSSCDVTKRGSSGSNQSGLDSHETDETVRVGGRAGKAIPTMNCYKILNWMEIKTALDF